MSKEEIDEMALDYIINTGGLPKTITEFQNALNKFHEHLPTKCAEKMKDFISWCADEFKDFDEVAWEERVDMYNESLK